MFILKFIYIFAFKELLYLRMSEEEFIKYIECIGFEIIQNGIYGYKELRIYLYYNYYTFYNGYKWHNRIPYNDLTQVLKSTRSHKLKQLLR